MTATLTAPDTTYRKTKTGEWVAYGLASRIQPDYLVTIVKANGDTDYRTVERTGRPFTVGGQEMVYGYLAPRDSNPGRASECDNGHRRYVATCHCCRYQIGQ
jgi:hypothetical protein